MDTVILGCTHYPLLRQSITAVTDRLPLAQTNLLDSGHSTAEAVARSLEHSSLLNRRSRGSGTHRFLLTDLPEGFVATAERFFGRTLRSECEHVDIVDATATPPVGS